MRHNWPKWWAARTERLPKVNWDRFRRDKFLMGGLQSKHRKLSIFWDRCEEDGVPLKVREDCRIGDPEGETRDGIFVTAGSLKMAYHLHRILSRWEPPEAPRVLEIGGGIGCMARTAVLNMPKSVGRYTLVDGPPCLEIQRRYLGEVFPDEAKKFIYDAETFEFVRHDQIFKLKHRRYDLVINMHSFNEMTKDVVTGYFDLIQDVLDPGGALYIYGRNRFPPNTFEVNVPAADFPFDDRWKFILPVTDKNWVEVLAVRR